MSLPDLALQIVYGRLAWALVAAAMLLTILPAVFSKISAMSNLARPLTAAGGMNAIGRARRATVIAVAALVVLMALPGAASPAYWLTLVFQYPSGLLVGFSAVSLYARWHGRSARFAMPAGLALPLALAGLVLYLDAFGVLALGLYGGGFAGLAPLLACAAACASAFAIVRGHDASSAAAVLIGVLPYSLLRLPSGNLWDALLDPLLWSWAIGSVVVAAVRQRAARNAGQLAPQAAPAPAPDTAPLPEPVLAHAAGNEQI